MMQTGDIGSWVVDPNTIGPMYPFAGTEMIWVILLVVVWLAWTIWQMRSENAAYRETAAALRKGNKLQEAVGE